MRPAPTGRWLVRPVSLLVAVGGLVLTGVLTWAASTANHSSTRRLLTLQVHQAAATLAAALPSLQPQLGDALQVVTATRSPRDFESFAADKVGGTSGLVSLSLWETTPTGARRLALLGRPPQIVANGKAQAFFRRVHPSTKLQVTEILRGDPPRLGVADMTVGEHRYLVYGEYALPSPRRIPPPKSSVFSDLGFALYLGRDQVEANLIESTVATPVQGLKAVASTPFGDSAITFVGTPTTELTGGLSSALPWIVLGVGAGLSLASASVVEYVARRRLFAEQLAADVSVLYSEQHSIAETLQRAILPQEVLPIPGMAIAVRYVPGVAGIEVGGDWYDVEPIGDGRFVFVVGDVSGRGVQAAAVMASLHYASRGFALEGHPPETIIDQLAKTLDIARGGNFATVICGLVDVERHEVTLANAGHLPPVVTSDGIATRLETRPVAPIGVSTRAAAEPTTVQVHPHSTLVIYTDGLIERRGETIEDGIQRLEASAVRPAGSVDEMLDNLVADLVGDSPNDDVALIGMRWLS